ncbi:hypothetical protein U9M48_041669 [Paspalum notatum var. saurae]|uniref:NAB domain-containing protein n=1 Tax=Paspalum notatum var. saurae TaxID=547442 RepID=A0AAQ3UTN9_PASNO
MLQRAASNAYSWWWASHVRTKQSKWLDNSLKDMEDRVKCILFLLGEEADSFAKRAEMYYKRRPEVISSVEEAYRSYRALAERYDHMSGELHKANHTIATAFPDQIQYSLLEEDDDNLPKAFTTVDPRKIHKSTVEGLMKKKHGEKSGPKDGRKKSATPINRDNAQPEIGRLQKEILVLQTEKEFIKSSYESGIAKYWDLEKQINEMQEEVCYLQEEFNESAAIDDNEARALMTATALQSCEGSIIKMQEQQKSFSSQTMTESERLKVSRDKLRGIMRAHGKSLSYSDNSADENVKNDDSARKDELFTVKQEKIELQELVNKIKGYFELNSDISVVEIAEKIDELVNKVVDLELMISAQTAQMNRLSLENNELGKSLQKLEEEKTKQTTNSGELNDKLKEAEEELLRVHNLEKSYHAEERIFHTNFTETLNCFYDISHVAEVADIGDQEDGMMNLQELLMNGLQDKEKALLAEYTSILRNYKNAKRRLTEVETKNQESMNEMRAMISELECANGIKDAEIWSLRELLNSLTCKDASHSCPRINSTMPLSEKNVVVRGHRRTPSLLPVHQRLQSVSSIPRRIKNSSSLKSNLSVDSPKEIEAVTNPESIILEELTSINVVEIENPSPLEEKFRRDIDALLEENLAFLMKFSMSFQQIQGFQTKYNQLQSEIGKLTTEDKLKSDKDHTNEHHAKSEMEATEKCLRELKIELQVWLEQNVMLKGELQCRFDALTNIQAEIEGAMEKDVDTQNGTRFTSYQVARFQGEVLNMKQENNKVADELQSGLDHVKGLQAEIEKVMAKILKSTSLYGSKASSKWRNTPKSRVPLRMFLFPAKKKKPSMFACVNPAFLSKQNSDMAFFSKMS